MEINESFSTHEISIGFSLPYFNPFPIRFFINNVSLRASPFSVMIESGKWIRISCFGSGVSSLMAFIRALTLIVEICRALCFSFRRSASNSSPIRWSSSARSS